MAKVDNEFIIHSYDNGIGTYKNASEKLGLWESESTVIQHYFKPEDQILDLGCGAGRTTFGMYQMGLKHLTGLDLNPKMVGAAQEIATHHEIHIPFEVGDATKLGYHDEQFHAVLFSFNGLMTIPQKENRLKAFEEVWRVLKEEGIFIFTTHDREADTKYLDFWVEQKRKWEKSEIDPRVHDFGDLITPSNDVDREIYIHIPTRTDILEYLSKVGFKLIDDFYRPERFNENEAVKDFSGDCRFWIVQKKEK